jgi:hypothetical protein
MLPYGGHAVYFLLWFVEIPDLHGGVLGDRCEVVLVVQEADIPNAVLMLLEVG